MSGAVVAFEGQSTGLASSQTDPDACVFGSTYEISVDEARTLGIDVDADYAFLEDEWTGDVLVSGDTISRTKVHLLGRVDHVWRTDRTPHAGVALDEAVPPGCPPVVGYELTVQMFTEDASIAGVFPARMTATALGSAPALQLYSESDLRNFHGSLPVARDSARPFFAQAEVSWYSGSDSELVFNFQPRVFYQDNEGPCLEPFCPSASAPLMAPLSFGVASVSEMAPFTELVSSVAKPSVSSLTEFVATMGPYHPDVRLWVVASSADLSSVQVRVRIDGGDIQTAPLALTHDPQILTADAVGGWLDLGEVRESAPIEFEVENVANLSDVQAHILIGGCLVQTAGDRCTAPGCVAHNTVSVFPATCSSVN